MSAVEALQRLEAHEPPEERGCGRDDVALLVATRRDGARVGDKTVELRLSTRATADAWVVELRTEEGFPFRRPPAGARLDLPGGAQAELLAPYAGSDRLAVARLVLDEPVEDYLERHGRPIRYGYVRESWPIGAYQTV